MLAHRRKAKAKALALDATTGRAPLGAARPTSRPAARPTPHLMRRARRTCGTCAGLAPLPRATRYAAPMSFICLRAIAAKVPELSRSPDQPPLAQLPFFVGCRRVTQAVDFVTGHLCRLRGFLGTQSCPVGDLQARRLAQGEGIGPRDRALFRSGLWVAVPRTRHMNEFMKAFADVVRLPPPNRKPGSLEELLRDVARLFEPECQRLGIAWRWRIEDGVRPVRLDRGQMEQVLVNIVRNAIDAIGEDGDITVSLGIEQDVPAVLIEDSGGGIRPEVAPRLFTSFFSSKPNGQGIGLTLVQEILIAHGFDYSLETVAPGRAGFRIRFIDGEPR